MEKSIDSIETVLELFKDSEGEYKRTRNFEKPILGYIATLVATHNNLLSHNRRFFLGVSIALGGLAFVKFVEILPAWIKSSSIPGWEHSVTLLMISLAGFICNTCWKRTTYYRVHQVYFLSMILCHLEAGKELREEFASPMSLICKINNSKLAKIIRLSKSDPNDDISRFVTENAARTIYKWLRVLHLFGWCLCCLVSLNMIFIYDQIMDLCIVLNGALIVGSIVFIINESEDSENK